MIDIPGLFRALAFSLGDNVAIVYSADDPSAGGGYTAPRGSLLLRQPSSTGGEIWVKYGDGDTDWEQIGTATAQDTFNYGAGRDANTTDRYLEHHTVPMNEVPIVIPYDATLIYMSAASEGDETWDAEVHDFTTGVLIPGASLSMVSAAYGYSSVNVDIDAGARLMFYCNGNGVRSPSMQVVMERRA